MRTHKSIPLILRSRLLLAGLWIAFGFPGAASATPIFQYLGDLPGGSIYSAANGVSADGTYVVGASSSAASGVINPALPFDTEAFIWDAASGMIALGDLPGGHFSSVAVDVSRDGKVVVGSSVEANGSNLSQVLTAPFRWTRGPPAVMTKLGSSLVGAAYGTAAASSVSSSGDVVVGSVFWQDEVTGQAFSRGFRWPNPKGSGGVLFLTALPAQDTATAISPNGASIVGSTSVNGRPRNAYRKPDPVGDLEDLGSMGNVLTRPTAVSDDGMTLHGAYFPSTGGVGAFLWTQATETFKELRTSGGGVVGASADGRIALDSAGGLYLDGKGPYDLRDLLAETGAVDLRGLPSGLFTTTALSDNGLFAVGSAHVDGTTRAWRVRFTDCDGNALPDELERLAYPDYVSSATADGSERFATSRDSLGYGQMIGHYGRPWKRETNRVPATDPAAPAENLRAVARLPGCADGGLLNSDDAVRRFLLGAVFPAVHELHAFEMLLGNEAFADAQDPTIGLDGIAPSSLGGLFAFKGARGIDDLIDEELALLRGRELPGTPGEWVDEAIYYPEFASPVDPAQTASAAVYNRLPPNASGADAVAYRSNYSTADNHEAANKFPQGHGDAYGYYLTALKAGLVLLRDGPGGSAGELVDAVLALVGADDRALGMVADLAAAAAARAQAAAHVANLLFRRDYREDPEDPRAEELFADPEPERAWSMGEWARRGALGAYLDWAAVAHLAPTDESRPVHRAALAELDELAGAASLLQDRLDTAGAGLDPLGLVQNVVPFGIDAAGLEPGAGSSHYEQVRDAAQRAVDNARKAFEVANQASQRLRDSDQTFDDFTDRLEDLQVDYDQQLIEIYGLPSQDDPGDNDLDATTGDFAESQSHPDLTFFFATDEALLALGMRPRLAPGEVQLALSELRVAALRVQQAGLAVDDLTAQVRSQIERIELLTSVEADRLELISTACDTQEKLTIRLQQLDNAKGFFNTFVDIAVGLGTLDPGQIANGLKSLSNLAIDKIGGRDEIELERQRVECDKELGLQGLEDLLVVDAERRQLEALLRRAPQLLVDLATAGEVVLQAMSRVQQSIKRGELLVREKKRLAARTAGDLLEQRWRDLSFRVYRNAALKNYRALFDIAARFVVLAGRAYAYEFDARSDGEDALAGIYRERRLGDAAGLSEGLQGVLDRLNASVTVNNFNRPLETLGERSFSLRRNLLGIGVEDFPNDDLRFRRWLESQIVERLEDLGEVRELAQVSVERDHGPGIVIPFATEIDSRNFFGRGPELPYGNSNFSLTRNAKIRSFAIRLDGVDASLGTDPESGTVYVYLLPAGESVLRENTNQPRIEDELITPWAVVDQFLPMAPVASPADIPRRSYNPWQSSAQANGNFLNEIKRQRDAEAQIELGQPPHRTRYNTSLAGRSAWNTRWLFVIPGSQWTSSSDLTEIRGKLLQFIYGARANPEEHLGITDIRLIIQAYSH